MSLPRGSSAPSGPPSGLHKITLIAVTFPIYAAEGCPAPINVRRHRQPRDGLVFELIHIRDTLNLIDPDTLPRRLEAAGMVGPQAKVGGRSFRWRAAKLRPTPDFGSVG